MPTIRGWGSPGIPIEQLTVKLDSYVVFIAQQNEILLGVCVTLSQ